MLHWSVLLLLSLLIVARWAQQRAKIKGSRLPLPPGPKRLPILGNLLDVPGDYPWKGYHEMARIYGDMIYLQVLNQPVLILSSWEIVSQLLEKKSALYSDRPHSVMMIELMGADWALPAMKYGERWRKTRKVFHQYFNPTAIKDYQYILADQSVKFLRSLHRSPEEFLYLVRQHAASLIMKITYGIDIAEKDDEYVAIAECGTEGLGIASQVGRYHVEILPFLKYIPAWFPGADFQRDASRWKAALTLMIERPFYAVKSSLISGTASPCVALDMLSNLIDRPGRDGDEATAMHSAGVAFTGGADTTTSSIQAFFLAMTLYPEVQKAAQAELDQGIDSHRLPDFSNRDSLPYIDAVLREVLRWQPVTPLGVPRYTSDDDEQGGYFVPKGTVVVPNMWSLLHDPIEYPQPEAFIPERFIKDGKLNPNVRDPAEICFGFGRRICPGRFLALESIWLTIVSVLHVFEISQATDENGRPLDVYPRMTSGNLSIIPRRSVASIEALLFD